MLIDWFTVGAQALNFLILAWLLKRYLYGPILAAIDARERKIAATLAEAEAKRTEAAAERAEYRQKNESFERERVALRARAADEAKAERQRLLDAARRDADALAAKRREALRNEVSTLQDTLRTRTQAEIFAIARKVLRDLSSSTLEERMTVLFIERLRSLDPGTRAALGAALAAQAGPAIVRSAFELPERERDSIQQALDAAFGRKVAVRFEVSADGLAGIELTLDGQKVGWSIGTYLAALERAVRELAQAPGAPPGPAP